MLYTNLQYVAISDASSGATQLVAAPSNGQAIYVVSYAIVATGAVTVKFQSDTTDITGAMSLAANGGVSAIGRVEAPLFACVPNKKLNINLGGAVQVSGHLAYFLF